MGGIFDLRNAGYSGMSGNGTECAYISREPEVPNTPAGVSREIRCSRTGIRYVPVSMFVV